MKIRVAMVLLVWVTFLLVLCFASCATRGTMNEQFHLADGEREAILQRLAKVEEQLKPPEAPREPVKCLDGTLGEPVYLWNGLGWAPYLLCGGNEYRWLRRVP